MVDDDRLHDARKGDRRKHDESFADKIATAHVDRRTEVDGVPLKSRVIKRSVVIGGHRTSVCLEDAFWDGLKEIARARAAPISDIVRTIEGERLYCNLSSAIRLFVFSYFHK